MFSQLQLWHAMAIAHPFSVSGNANAIVMCNQCFDGMWCIDEQKEFDKFVNSFSPKPKAKKASYARPAPNPQQPLTVITKDAEFNPPAADTLPAPPASPICNSPGNPSTTLQRQ